MIQNDSTRRPNYWSIASLLFGILGLLFALTAPIPFVPVISVFNWPLGVAALLTGWKGGQYAKVVGDSAGASRARWGMRLGCLGWMVQFATSTVKVILITGFLVSAISTLVTSLLGAQASPTPAPIPTSAPTPTPPPDPFRAWHPDRHVYFLPFD